MERELPKALLITNADPWDEPRGGQSTFAKYLVKVYGYDIAVTSYCTERVIPVGKWVYRYYQGNRIFFMSRGVIKERPGKPVIPARIRAYYHLRRFLPLIRNLNVYNIIVDSPELLIAVAAYRWYSICFRFAGVNNPVTYSRYVWARIFGNPIEQLYLRSLRKSKTDVILACADSSAIDEFLTRTGHILDKSKVFPFPTRVDTSVFKPMPMSEVRKELDLPLSDTIIVSVARLSWIKGWDLLLSAIECLHRRNLYVKLIFVGDGEDRVKIMNRARDLNIQDYITITGFISQNDVSKYINAADICVVASYREGWSLAMLEMLACGKAIVSTNVSGARDLIIEGKNGYIIERRSPDDFADGILKGLALKDYASSSLEIATRYSLKTLRDDLGRLWAPLQ